MKPALATLAALLVTAACSNSAAPLVASDVVVNVPLPGTRMASGYLTLTNNGDDPVTISRVTSPQFDAVELHETQDENGVARMVELAAVTIGPSSSVRFEPGGKHLMLMRPTGDLASVTLEFFSGDEVVLRVDVTPGGRDR